MRVRCKLHNIYYLRRFFEQRDDSYYKSQAYGTYVILRRNTSLMTKRQPSRTQFSDRICLLYIYLRSYFLELKNNTQTIVQNYIFERKKEKCSRFFSIQVRHDGYPSLYIENIPKRIFQYTSVTIKRNSLES